MKKTIRFISRIPIVRQAPIKDTPDQTKLDQIKKDIMNNLTKTLFAGVAISSFCTFSPAYALEKPAADGTMYEAVYFDDYAPRTAIDMISRIPGFRFNSGDDGKRGLGQGGANVLINGARISGKSDAYSQLSRISAKSVLRIEIVDGASLGIPGLSGQVANVFTKSTGVTGTWEWYPEFRKDIAPNWLRGDVSVSGEIGNLSYSASLDSDAFRNGHVGPERQTDINGVLFEKRHEADIFYGENVTGAVDLTWTPKTDHIGNFNIAYTQFNFNSRKQSKRTPIHAPSSHKTGSGLETLFTHAEDEWNSEIGGDYEFPALMGKLKLIGYYRFEHSPNISRYDEYTPLGFHSSGSRYHSLTDEAEAILRSEFSWSQKEGRDWQIALEGAFNFLENTATLYNLNTVNGEYIANPNLTEKRTRVDEDRVDVSITHTRKLSKKWDVQTSLGAEYSGLSQANDSRNFFRPKGFVTTTYKPSASFTIRTKLEREVGQLNFFDFLSSVSLTDNQNKTGNANIVPQQSWNAEIEFDKTFGQGNSFKAVIFGKQISDLVDRIPIGENGDAIGNIDSAQQYGIELSSTLKGEQWGMKGLQLDATLNLYNSRVEDPLLGFTRRLSSDTISNWSLELRHDIPNTQWAYGVYIENYTEAPTYRLRTISNGKGSKPYSQIFVEHKDVYGMKIRGIVGNLLDMSDEFYQIYYTDRRDKGIVDRTEKRSQSFGLIGRVRVSGTF
ncbi:MAG: hypothetical protein COA43_02815 [Robiginitomaculum sp.]|nr:MAG: hypothetical protein COA43_02815 [Robiginitomaculum sp.]